MLCKVLTAWDFFRENPIPFIPVIILGLCILYVLSMKPLVKL